MNIISTRLLWLLFVCGFGYAQDRIPSIAVAGGYEPNGYFAQVAYSQLYGKHKFKLEGQYHQQTFEVNRTSEEIDAQLFTLGLAYYRQLWSYKGRDLVFYGGAGIIGGIEDTGGNQNGAVVNVIVAEGTLDEQNVIYGGHLGVEVEKYLVQLSENAMSLSLFLNARQHYLFDTLFDENTMLNISLGIRLNL